MSFSFFAFSGSWRGAFAGDSFCRVFKKRGGIPDPPIFVLGHSCPWFSRFPEVGCFLMGHLLGLKQALMVFVISLFWPPGQGSQFPDLRNSGKKIKIKISISPN